MPVTGSWSPIPLCEKGGKSLVDHDYANQLIQAVNALAQPRIGPTANTVGFAMSRTECSWDFSGLVALLLARLNTANAVANCVGNTIQITFTI